MTTQAIGVDAEILSALEAFAARTMPGYLRADSPMPVGWPYSLDAWRELQAKARGLWIEQAVVEYVRQLSQGWTLRELAHGPEYGQQVYASGAPVREPASALSDALQRQASDLLQEAANRGLRLDAGEEMRLRHVANGYGNPQTAAGVVDSVHVQIRSHDAERRAATQEADSRPWLVVTIPFRGPGGKSFAVGRQRVDPALADELHAWAEKMVAEQQRHGWESPPGFAAWPPFTLGQP